MDAPQLIVESVSRYHREYRNAALAPPSISGLYALFPKEAPSSDPELHWPAKWPHSDSPGAYVVLDANEEILYVGKASILGRRVGQYFPESRDDLRACTIRHAWVKRPVFVVFVAIGERFEAPSLEEYLIQELKPLENKLWGTRKSPAAELDDTEAT